MSVAAAISSPAAACHPLAVEADSRQHPVEGPQAELDRVGGVEERLLVLLQVLRVGERQAVQDPGERRVRRRRPAGAFARRSSAASGFIFCGMIDEPEEKSSARRQKPNSLVDQRTISAPIRDRWVAQVAAALR